MPKPSHIGAVDSFMAEARRVARLKHPGIVPVHDVGKDGDDFFIVSEFVEDGSLGDRLKQGPIPPEQSCRWLAEIADALDYAHKNGVIHRDIKPANILIDHHGRALLADFGIALSANKTGQFAPSIGTLAYMSPEQLEGKPLDPRSDVYSVGVLLCQLLTGKLPYDARDTNSLRKEIVSGAIRLSGNGGRLSPELRGICLKCLAHDPKERYATAKDLANDLRSVQPIKSHRTALVISGIAVLVILLSMPFVWKTVFRSNESGVAETPKDHAPLSALTRTIGPEDGLKLPVGLMANADGHLHVANTGIGNIRVYSQSGVILREYGVPGRDEGQLHFPQFFATSSKADFLAITDYGRNCVSLYSTDGRFLKSFGALGDGTTTLKNPRGIASKKAGDFFVVDSGNHRILVFNSDGEFLRSVGSAGSGRGQLREPSGIALSPDGRTFVADTGNRRIVVFNADSTPAMVLAHEQPRTEPFALAFSPSGRLFVSDHFNECVQVFDKELKYVGSIRPPDGEFLPMGLAFLPDGILAVANYRMHSILLFDVGEAVADNNGQLRTRATAALAHGKRLFDEKNYEAALVEFTEAVNADSGRAEPYHRRALCRVNLQRYEDALPDFVKAVELDPSNPEIRKHHSIALSNLGRWDEAIAVLEAALKLSPADPTEYHDLAARNYSNRAKGNAEAGRWDTALPDLSAAIRHDPKPAIYYRQRGAAYFNLKQFEPAVADFTAAIEREPKEPSYYQFRGEAYKALGKQKEADADFEQARRLANPQSKRPDPITNSIGMVLVHIPAGEFLMGTPENDPSKAWDEIPHRVRISKPFFMGKFEVTQAQYQKVMGKNPSYCAKLPNPEQHPVEQVSWDDAVAFCRALTEIPEEKAAGRSYRLPTEVEWEYACRAGTTTAYHFGNDPDDLSKYAIFGGHKAGVWATQKVGIKLPNAWGLYDMHGGVWEWCADEYGPYRVATEVVDPQGSDNGVGKVARGGSWDYGAIKCRSAQRYGGEVLTRSFTNFAFGFRVVMVQEARP